MTPEEVFAQLRDIHVPASDFTPAPTLDLRPLLAFALFAIAVSIAVHLRSRSRAKAALARIDPHAPPAVQRDDIAHLLATTRPRRKRAPPPTALYQTAHSLTQEDITGLRQWAARQLS